LNAHSGTPIPPQFIATVKALLHQEVIEKWLLCLLLEPCGAQPLRDFTALLSRIDRRID
jgi:hypothetical protein